MTTTVTISEVTPKRPEKRKRAEMAGAKIEWEVNILFTWLGEVSPDFWIRGVLDEGVLEGLGSIAPDHHKAPIRTGPIGVKKDPRLFGTESSETENEARPQE